MYVELGKIVGVWGVKGWIKLHSYTRNRVDIAKYSTWYLQEPRKKADPVAISVINCREQQTIFVKKADLPKLPDGEFYWQQLIGLEVANDTKKIGVVSSILETGANDVLVIKQEQDGQADVLIPYTEQTVLEVNLEGGTMIVDWDPSYLLD